MEWPLLLCLENVVDAYICTWSKRCSYVNLTLYVAMFVHVVHTLRGRIIDRGYIKNKPPPPFSLKKLGGGMRRYGIWEVQCGSDLYTRPSFLYVVIQASEVIREDREL